ncbi:MAG TPA: hypothetical protein VJ044_05645, partial [Candidatus Hodarchaeales archaeon]|nr:hypothetical protein [Candidatus Hodarchaeales archaeon]
NLIVCELKQGTVTESAIIQALGYASEYAKYDRDDLADRLLAHVKKGHISGLTLNTIEDARQAVYAKISGDKSANSEVPINESQVVLLVGEAFSPNVLSIVDYLNNSSDALSYLIECWRYQLFPLAADQFQLAFEQILPPPNIREEIAQKREEIRSRKYARDPKRIAFMGWLISQLNGSNDFEAWRNPGASYYCNIIKKTHDDKEFVFDIYGEHPTLTLPTSAQSDKLPNDLKSKVITRNNRLVIELADVNSNALEANPPLLDRIKQTIITVIGAGV